MASVDEDKSPQTITYRTLRAVNTVAGLCGLILNTVTLTLAMTGTFNGHSVSHLTSSAYMPIVFSIAWNHLEPCAQRIIPAGYRWATVFVDAGLFLGFLAILIAGGIIQHDLSWVDSEKHILLTYNNMPWIVCA